MFKTFTKCCRNILPFFLALMLAGGAFAQSSKVPLSQALEKIAKTYNARFAYEHKVVQGKFVSADAISGRNIDEALKNVLYQHNLIFLYVSEKQYTIVDRGSAPKESTTPAQEGTASSDYFVSGKVYDREGFTLPGATVKSNASNATTRTDSEGKFAFFVPAATTALAVSYLGYDMQQIAIGHRKSDLKVLMTPSSAAMLEEVNVVSNGYQTLPKERATGSAVSITPELIERVPVPNIMQIIESAAEGLKVTLNAAGTTMMFGNNYQSINGGTRTRGASDYSMSIRGASTLRGETFPLVVIDGAITDLDLSTINPNDIANISILKDAAAASIWGTRAANGVIVVTTKKGRNNQAPQVSFGVVGSVSNAPDLDYLRIMNSAQTIQFEQEMVNKGLIIRPLASTALSQPVSEVTDLTFKLRAGEITQGAYDAIIGEYSTRDSRDQIKEYFLRPASNQQYNFSVRGGGNASSYFYSASYASENAYAKGNDVNRLTVSMNNDFKLFNLATLSTSVRGSFLKFDENGLGLNSFFSPSATTFMPYDQIVNASGQRVYYNRRYYSGWTNSLMNLGYLDWRYNALDELENSDNGQRDNNYTVNLNLNVPLFRGLSANAFYGTERSFTQRKIFYNEASYYYRDFYNNYTPVPLNGNAVNAIGLSPGRGGIYNINNLETKNFTLRGQLNYDGTLAENHVLTALAGAEIRETDMGAGVVTLYGYNMQTGVSIPVNNVAPYSTIAGYAQPLSTSPSQQDKRRRYLSYFANAAYTYRSKYTLSGSVRYDDYNNFGLDRKFRATPLYSMGLKWDINKETFLRDAGFLDMLSLRATYGVNGNISTTSFPFTNISLYNDYITGLPSASISAPANPELRWEKTYVTNIGLNFGLFSGKLNGSVDVYRKKGEDLFAEFPVNGTYGFTNLLRNTATMKGKGVDVSLAAKVYQTKDLGADIRLIYSYNTNEITDNRFGATASFFSNPAYGATLAGFPSDKVLVYRNAGLDANGLTQVYNEKNEIVAINQNLTSVEALKFAGRSTAPHFGSVSPSVRYKNFTLLAVATYQFGNVFLRPSISSYSSSRQGTRYDLSADIAKRWQQPGDEVNTNVPGIAGTFAPTSLLRYQQSDINVLKGDYIRLRELSLTYGIPVSKITGAVKSANVAFNVRNLGLLWTANKEGWDPDFATPLSANTLGLPAAVSYNISLNVNF